MRKFLLCLVAIGISSNICALTLKDIIRLSQTPLDDQVIVSIIKTSDSKFKLSTDEVISLKNNGVSDKVILAIIESGPPKVRRRELSPFDQFFLSPYYSHQYGWPEPNYKSPSDILALGLYYQPPESYPDARRMRIYGGGYSYDRRRDLWNYSPYSLIVPRKRKRYRYSRTVPKKRNIYRNSAKPSPKYRVKEISFSPSAAQQKERKLVPLKFSENRISQRSDSNTQSMGEWYSTLQDVLDTLEKQAKLSSELNLPLTFYFIDIQSYIRKMRRYENMVQSIQFRTRSGNGEKYFANWIATELKQSRDLEKKNTLRAFKSMVAYGKVDLGVEDEIMGLIVYSVDWQRNLKKGKLPEQLLKNIISRLEVIQQKFSDFYNRVDDELYQYEVQ